MNNGNAGSLVTGNFEIAVLTLINKNFHFEFYSINTSKSALVQLRAFDYTVCF